jgi:RNase P/RNase MRP subunit p30
MFIDVCFPNKNEEKFIEVAKKLKTDGLIFVYNKSNDSKYKFNTFQAQLNKYEKNKIIISNELVPNYTKKNNIIFYYNGLKDEKKNFFQPLKNVNQVFFKQIKNKPFGISFSYLINNSYKDDIFEKYKYLITLGQKYNVKLFISSFAKTPFELRSKNELSAIFSLLKIKSNFQKNSFSILDNFLNK